MSESPSKRPRITPRNSIENENLSDDETPYSNLRQLAGLIRRNPSTPLIHGQHPTPVAVRVAKQTQGTATRTPASQRRDKARREIPKTTHALRAFERQRHATATPGDRRRSGRLQRETPRDVLRPLSKLLSRNTLPIEPSPQVSSVKPRHTDDDWIDEPDAPAPRLSMPLDVLEDDDSLHGDPPQLSSQFGDDDENITARSFEGPRRALAEMGNSRLSRGSLGSLRVSDQFGDLKNMMDITELEEDNGKGNDPTGTITRFGLADGDLMLDTGESTQEMRALLNAASRRQSRFGDAGPVHIDDEPDPTFHFALPEVQDEQRVMQDSPVATGDDGSHVTINDDESHAAADDDDNESIAVPNDEVEEDHEPQDYSDEEAPAAPSDSPANGNVLAAVSATHHTAKPARKPRQREIKVSRNGMEYPSLPSGVIKRIASTFIRSNRSGSPSISRETVTALSQATDWFFEQVSEDLASYSEHAGRKMIDEADVITLMRRQRLLNANTTPFSLAQKYLPRELLQSVRFGAPAKLKRRKRTRLSTIREDEAE
ncbi:MAG: hypothetical protein M1821_005276 [Bathelium mastoideum]|nr:MAG: hypothetical protein M1821_005276 [Bathelium mastoideum]KAI9689155.1 MAG: hypothetical protein M1822_000893 [Bathelium mastoideum]